MKPRKPKDTPFEPAPGVFGVTGSNADTEKRTGTERYLRGVEHHLQRAENGLVKAQLPDAKRRELKIQLADVRAKIAAMLPGYGISVGEMLTINEALRPIREFGFRQRFNDDQTKPAHEGNRRKAALHDQLIIDTWQADKTDISNLKLVNDKLPAKERFLLASGEKRFNRRKVLLRAAGLIAPKMKKKHPNMS
jgi:hypothetical protein